MTDLGLDRIFLHAMDPASGKLAPLAAVGLDAGRGPRHLLFHPRLRCAYVGNELDSTVTVLSYNEEWDAAPLAAGAVAMPGVPLVGCHEAGAPLRHVQNTSRRGGAPGGGVLGWVWWERTAGGGRQGGRAGGLTDGRTDGRTDGLTD